jgi:hypothetical protein
MCKEIKCLKCLACAAGHTVVAFHKLTATLSMQELQVLLHVLLLLLLLCWYTPRERTGSAPPGMENHMSLRKSL